MLSFNHTILSISLPLFTTDIVQFRFVLYYSILLLILGSFGNLFSICIFLRRRLRLIPCSWYFLALTCSNFLTLYMVCLTYMLIFFGYNPHTYEASSIFCKICTYFTYANLTLSIWLEIGACVDRWAATSTNLSIKSFSHVKIAKQVIIGITSLVYLFCSEIFFCYDNIDHSTSIGCYPISNACDLYNQYAFFLTYSFLPCGFILVFGLLTIRNIQKTRRRIAPLRATLHYRNTEKKIRQMNIMLLVEVIFSILFYLPMSLQKVYYVITFNHTKSIEQQQVEYFIHVVVILISLTNSAISFYIFACTGHVFRKELKRILFSKCVTPVPLRAQQMMIDSLVLTRKQPARHFVL
jgi:hypothetical protein